MLRHYLFTVEVLRNRKFIRMKRKKTEVTNESQKITTVKVTYKLLTLSEETKCPSLSSVVIK